MLNRSFRITNNILIVLITLWGLAFFLVEAVIYLDSSHVAHPGESQRWSLLWFAITDVLGDIAILAMPYPCIRRLQMSSRVKVGISAIFLLGTLWVGFSSRAYAVSIIRVLESGEDDARDRLPFAKRECTTAYQSEEYHCHVARILT